VPLSIKEKLNGLTLKATIKYLAKLCAVSIHVELAFLAPDRKNQARTAGLTPDNIRGSRCLRGNAFHWTSKVNALCIGNILLLRQSTERDSSKEK
jgi:hypothetical protein